MSYDKIDTFIKNWSTKHKLYLQTEYKDCEVRSVYLEDKSGNKYQIWIDYPNDDGTVEVHAWNFKSKKKDFTSTIKNIGDTLEQAYSHVLDWIEESDD